MRRLHKNSQSCGPVQNNQSEKVVKSKGGSQEMAVVVYIQRLMAKILAKIIALISCGAEMRQHRTFAINLYHHSHFLPILGLPL